MAQLNEQVLAMVRREIEKDPAVTNDVLREKAASIDRSIRKMNGRQFHGSYRLTAARAVASSGGRPKKVKTKATRPRRQAGVERVAARDARAVVSRSMTPEASSVDRSAIRGALLEFAGEIAKADSKAEMIGVLSSMDRYVDRLVAATAHSRART